MKVLAFDVSETLQTGADHNDNSLGQAMVDQDGRIIPGAFSVLVGGTNTAALIKQAQARGMTIVLVTNNGADLDKGVVDRTLQFLAKYGITVAPENYMGPPRNSNGNSKGSKVPRLEEILSRFNIDKDELVFFDDSRSNIREAQEQGFQAIHVRTAEDLQQGITNALKQPVKSPVQNKNNSQPSDLIPYEKLDVKVRQYLSFEMQTERHKLGLSTSEFWQTRSRKEQDEILAKFAAPLVVEQQPNQNMKQIWCNTVTGASLLLNYEADKTTVKELKEQIIAKAKQDPKHELKFNSRSNFTAEDFVLIRSGKALSDTSTISNEMRLEPIFAVTNRKLLSQNQSSMFNSFKNLPTDFKAFISEKTQTDRHAIGHMSVSDYWSMLDTDEQDDLQEEFAMQQSLAHSNKI